MNTNMKNEYFINNNNNKTTNKTDNDNLYVNLFNFEILNFVKIKIRRANFFLLTFHIHIMYNVQCTYV